MKDKKEILKQLHHFLSKHETEYHSIDEAVKDFFIKMTEEDEDFSKILLLNQDPTDHLFEKLPFAETESEYQQTLKEILKIEPDNLHARLMALNEESPSFLKSLEDLLESGERMLKQKKFFGEDSIEDYWQNLETRPFILIKFDLAQAYGERRMKRKAVEQLEEILRLNKQDHLGVRHELMALYNDLEEMEKAVSLYKEFEDLSAFMLLPLILLSLKKDDELSAKRYYKTLQVSNKNCRAVFGKMELDIEKWEHSVDEEQFNVGSVEEIYLAIDKLEDDFLLFTVDDYYFQWLKKHLNKPKKEKDIQKKK